MKILSLILCGAALCMAPIVWADDACCAAGINVAQKLQEIDLKVQLAEYEKIRSVQMELQLKTVMVRLDMELSGEERERVLTSLHQRIAEVRNLADEVRAQALELGKSLQVAAKQ